jgi:hypothetical protein
LAAGAGQELLLVGVHLALHLILSVPVCLWR